MNPEVLFEFIVKKIILHNIFIHIILYSNLFNTLLIFNIKNKI